jgi:transcriptional regulator with PAS, ATPase and Fis domain
MQSFEARHRDALDSPRPSDLAEVIGSCPQIDALRKQVCLLLRSHRGAHRVPSVLLLGETGTGKGQLAQIMHRASPRARGAFVHMNCAAIPENLLEGELFGFQRGAFTGATCGKPGLLETAHGGTLFLDEIDSLPMALQPKLLLAIEERVIRRLGGLRGEPVDFWVVAATNDDLLAAVRSGRFREDLYYRLSTIALTLPPLRERAADILTLADHFLARACRDYGRPAVRLSADARAALLAYPWPGNVRELANSIERTVLLSDGPTITARELNLSAGTPRPLAEPTRPSLRSTLDAFERARIVEALRAAMGNLSRAASSLGVPRNTLRHRIRRLGIAAELEPAGRREPRELFRHAEHPMPPGPAGQTLGTLAL